MAKTRVVLHNTGFAQLRNSAEVMGDLRRRGEAIAAAAGPGVEVNDRPTGARGRVAVVTADNESRRAEAKDRALTRAIDAGRA